MFFLPAAPLLSVVMTNVVFLLLYVSGGRSFPKPLTPAEERKYLQLSREGDKHARDVLIERNLRLVVHIIKKYYSSINDQDDLISIGTMGLIKAIDTFDIKKGTHLATYAARCIENEILMYFRSYKKSAGDISLNDPIDTDKDGNTLSLIDILSCEESIIDNVDLENRVTLLHKFMDSMLTDRERNIIIMRYGLNGTKPKTQQQIAKLLNISRSYVSRIEKKALQNLYKAFINYEIEMSKKKKRSPRNKAKIK
ncbi:MAG: RNA polymerase sporulation sigma factor SigK [Bacillota bacterium]|nr:RNA polymerase sporulation sigma factor SigK [Bacillota bacterium]